MSDSGIDTSEVIAIMAGAMREKRKELIARPLAEIWVQLARAGLDAADKFRAQR